MKIGAVFEPRLLLAACLAAGAAQAQQAAPQAPVVSTAQPSAGVCPAGGKFITDAFSPKPAFPKQTRAPRAPASTGYSVQTVVGDVPFGRSMAFLPDGRMLLAERAGRLRLLGRDGGWGADIKGVPPIPDASGLIGLMDIVVDPHFAETRRLYLSFVTPLQDKAAAPENFGHPPEGVGHIAVARLSENGDRLEQLKVLYQGARVRRIAVAADGTVLFSTVSSGNTGPQALDHDDGKILRINADGSAPADNPFAARTDVGRFAYDLGHRDPDGLALDGQGAPWTVEHGPRGGDELNLIRAGRNYGFPVITYGREYSGAEINGGLTVKEGMEQPVYYWTPDIAPSGLMVYSGKMFPQWKGNLFLGGLVAESLIRLTLDHDSVASEEFMLADRCARIRDVREAPDGSIYVLTDAADGKVLRLAGPDRP